MFALIVLGIFIAAFMYREIIIPMYLILIVYSIFKLINFLTTLQKIINYSSDFSIDALKKARFEEKNLTKLRENIASLNEGFNDAVSDRIKNERLKAELVTNISHDLKTPLTSIINYTDILLNKDISDEEKEDYIRILNTKGLKLKLLIEGLFEISKITSGKEGINKEEVNIVELISQSIGELSSSINESNLDFIMGTNSQDVKISLDGKKMSRVFENLITNATKYSLRGTRVYIDVNDFEDRVNISFKNISKDKVELDPDEIFNRFTRGDKTRNSEIEGSGLGLAIAKSIVDIHDGCIEVTIDGDLFKVVITLYK
ncbi:MAG: histidine kinase dimerization/phospho-acceptor domain-containing protein [Clostridium sp.]